MINARLAEDESVLTVRQASIYAKAFFSLGDIFCLFGPLLQAIQIPVVGTLLASDLLLLAVLPVAVLRHTERLRERSSRHRSS